MIEQTERRVVIVLSMHRCGSSLTTNILQRLGMSLGPFELNGTDPSNPYGHFEAVPFLLLNRRIQGLAHGFMEDLPDSPDILARFCATKGEWDEAIHIPEDLVAEGRSLIRALVDSGPISGFKDPRTVLTWPFWKRVLADFPNVPVVPVSILRSPHEIAMSLVTRRGGWLGYWTSLDVIAVHLRRQKLILESWEHRPPSLCFGSPSYLKTLEIAVSKCGLTWNTATVLDLFDRSCVHQSPAAVHHEAQNLFEAVIGGEAARQDSKGNQIQQEKDARALENLRLRQWRSHQDQVLEAREQARHAAQCAAEIESQLRETLCRLAELEQTRHELHSQIIDTKEMLIQAQEREIQAQQREIQAWQRTAQLRERLERFESHPILGPAIRGRRRLRNLIHSRAISPSSNGGESHRTDPSH